MLESSLFPHEKALPFVECFNVEMRSSPIRNKDIHGNISDEIKRSLHSSRRAQGNVLGKYDVFDDYATERYKKQNSTYVGNSKSM